MSIKMCRHDSLQQQRYFKIIKYLDFKIQKYYLIWQKLHSVMYIRILNTFAIRMFSRFTRPEHARDNQWRGRGVPIIQFQGCDLIENGLHQKLNIRGEHYQNYDNRKHFFAFVILMAKLNITNGLWIPNLKKPSVMQNS